MKSLQERQQERALRMTAAMKGEDIAAQLETQELIDAKNASIEALKADRSSEFVQPQFAVGPVRETAAPEGVGVDKRIMDEEGNVVVDGDPANKEKPSEKAAKVSAATTKAASSVAKAAASVGTWTANIGGSAGNGGGDKKE